MIIGTVTLLMLLFGGGSIFSVEKAFKPFLKDAVKDKARYEQIVDLTKQADEHIKAFHKENEDVWTKELKTLMADYDTSEDQFRDVAKKVDQSRLSVQQKIFDVRFDVAELMTEDEWNAMYQAIEKKAEEEKKEG